MKKHMMGLLAAAALLAADQARATVVSNLDDIQLWVGSGANRSALVIDFHYGGSAGSSIQSFVWGYRWDGSATGEDMLTEITASDSALEVLSPNFVGKISYNSFGNIYSREADFFVDDVSWGYYLTGGQAATFDAVTFAFTGYANISGGGASFPTSWTIASSGSADRLLADGSWDAWSFGAYDPGTFEHEVAPGTGAVAAIPEPGSLLLLLTGLGALCFKRRRRCHS